MTADTRELIGAALRRAETSALVDDLCRPEDAPPALFAAPTPKSGALMAAMDRVNAKFGRNTLFPAAMGVERGWKLRAAHHSPRHTTRLDELPRVRT